MTGRHKMRAFGQGSGNDGAEGSIDPETQAGGGTSDDMLDPETVWADEEAEGLPPSARFGWTAPTLALLVVAGWTGFFIWAHFDQMHAGTAPDAVAGWVVQWAVPVALVGIVWLLAMRSSHAEARRFSATAGLMNREGAALEQRLKVVNRELSLAREFLAAEARDLEALGRIAAERLSSHAAELQSLVVNNGAQVEAISTTSKTALDNMNRLRDDLPVIANASRDVANQIGSAGRVAEEQLNRLSGGFDRLANVGSESEKQVGQLSAQVGDTLAEFEASLARVETAAAERFAALQAETQAHRDQLGSLETEALSSLGERSRLVATETEAVAARLREASESAETRFNAAMASFHEALLEKLRVVDGIDRNTTAASSRRIAELREHAITVDDQLAERAQRFEEMINARQSAIETREAQASEVLAQRLSALDDALAQRREAQVAEIEKLVAHGEALGARVAELGEVIAQIDHAGSAARDNLGQGLGTLTHQLAEKRDALAATHIQLEQLTDSSVRLLEILQAGARTCQDELTTAISDAGTVLESVETRAETVGALMLRTSESGSDLSDYLLRTRSEIDAAEVAVTGFKSRLAEETEDALARVQGLRGGFARLAEEGGALANETQETLRIALGTLEAAITQTFAALDDGARDKILSLAQGMGTEAAGVLERTMRNETAAAMGKLEQSAAHASGVGREAAIQLRDQLVKVNELTGNLEQRVTRARELAEEQVNNDFARRMVLITDSLNSAAIDINSALDVEVTDTAWDAYLKGDRGIFTRRAVRLIGNGMARDIASLYSSDEAFKANVSRYIHDFEALLRQTLSTRDGDVLSVTMLGSDMGKLYVALAQSIQRLRT